MLPDNSGSAPRAQHVSRCKSKHRVTKHVRSRRQEIGPAGTFLCFSLAGDDVSIHQRSSFSNIRKREVKDIRKKGACLRCRLLKRACSGEDPCKTCISAARSAIGSRALMWMECIRPSFQAMNIFGGDYSSINQSHVDKIVSDLLNDDVYLDFHIPFELNVEAASAHLASWLADESGSSTFSVVGVFSCSTNTSLLENSLDPNLCRDLRLFVHLTTHLYTTGMQGGYHEYTDEEIQSARNCVGKRLLLALDPLLRPTELEIAEDKLGKLQSLFLLLLGTTIGMKYARREAANLTDNEIESKYEAISRLLCYYLIYIGKAASLLTAGSDEKTLVSRWESQWNKPAAFTWNPTRGFEMHYRIEPPADWIVSRSEDESMDSIDIDLTDFDQTEEFTMNTDLLKCAGCGSFWASLDVLGLCHECGPAFSSTGFGSEGSIPISDTCIYTSFSAHPDCTFNDVASPSWSMLECPKSFETLAIEKTTPAIDPQDSDCEFESQTPKSMEYSKLMREYCGFAEIEPLKSTTRIIDSLGTNTTTMPLPAQESPQDTILANSKNLDITHRGAWSCGFRSRNPKPLNRHEATSTLDDLQELELSYLSQTPAISDSINHAYPPPTNVITFPDSPCPPIADIVPLHDLPMAQCASPSPSPHQRSTPTHKRQYKCSVSYCGASFTRFDNLRRHERRCNENSYFYSTCGTRKSSRRILEIHKRAHSSMLGMPLVSPSDGGIKGAADGVGERLLI